MPLYRLYADADGSTHLEARSSADFTFEAGPGAMKGIGGTVLGKASWLTLMRFEAGVRPELHRVGPGFAVLLEGALVVAASDGTEQLLAPGDAVHIESTGSGGWAPANPGPGLALLAMVRMEPPPAE